MTIYSTGGEGSPGLYKYDATTDLIPSADATLEAGTEGYGIQATTTSGDITIAPKYLLTGYLVLVQLQHQLPTALPLLLQTALSM